MAKKIVSIQFHILEQVGEKLDGAINLEKALKYDETDEVIFVNRGILTLEHIRREFILEALRVRMETKEIQVRLTIISNSGGLKIHEFWVGFFDFPSIDNTRLSNNQRCAIVLKQFDEKENFAEVTLLYFPGDYASLKDKPYIEDMIRKLRLEKPGQPMNSVEKSFN